MQEAMMHVSGAGRYDAYGKSSQEVLSASYSNDASLLTTSTSSSDPGASLFGSASATSLFGTSGNPFGDTASLFSSSSSSSTSDLSTEINALRSRLTTQKTSLTNLASVTLEGVAQKSDDYIAQGSDGSGSTSLGSLIDMLA